MDVITYTYISYSNHSSGITKVMKMLKNKCNMSPSSFILASKTTFKFQTYMDVAVVLFQGQGVYKNKVNTSKTQCKEGFPK